MFRSRVFVLLASVLIALGVTAATVVPASAATDTITIVSVSSPATAVGELAVVADSTTPITSLAVHLLNASGTDVLDPAMSQTSQETISTGYQSTWTVTAPIAVGTSAPGLPLGSYTASVDAADTGTSVTGVNGGTYQFKDVLTLTIAANHTVLSYDDQSVTVTGTATVLAPGATSPAPFANQQITLAVSADGSDIPLTTDASGNYSYTFTSGDPGTVFTYLNPTATTFAAVSAQLPFTIHWDPVKISAKLSASTVTYGTKVTLSGELTYEPDSSYVPLAGQKVAIYSSMNVNAPVATLVTGADGDFSVVLPQTTSSQVWILDAGDGVGGPYLSAATASLAEHVQIPTAITGFRVSLNQYWQLGYSGCLALARPIPGMSVAQTSGLTIQYAPGPAGPWRTLAKSVSTGGSCGTSGIAFSGTATAPSNYAYYRAVYAGVTGLDTTDYTPASTGSVLVWKYEDRITGFSVSARVVDRNAKLTVKGQLQYWYSGWHDYRGQQILIVLRPKGSSTWYWIAKVNTNATGHFSATIKDPVSATWSAVFEGNSSHLDAGAAQIYVRVRLSAANRELIQG